MTDGNGTAPNALYQTIDRKVDAVEAYVRAEISGLRVELQGFQHLILEKLDRNSKPGSPYQLILTAIAICTVLGSIFGYVSNNLGTSITQNSAAIERETSGRERDKERVYAYILENYWPKSAQTEFEKRMDERKEVTDKQLLMVAHTVDTLANNVVTRAEHEQRWKDEDSAIAQVTGTLTASLNRIQERLNKTDEVVAGKISDLDHSVHGFGLPDEVKDLQSQVHDLSDKIFGFSNSSGHSSPPK